MSKKDLMKIWINLEITSIIFKTLKFICFSQTGATGQWFRLLISHLPQQMVACIREPLCSDNVIPDLFLSYTFASRLAFIQHIPSSFIHKAVRLRCLFYL